MNYSEFGKYGINMAVAKVEYPECVNFFCDVQSKDTVSAFDKDGICVAIVDYCNNPNDAMPIVFGNKIDIVAPRHSNNKWAAQSLCGVNSYYASDESALKAAMIVYLQMNEDKL